MILRTLRIERFGRFAEGEWEFASGLTVVRGPNEAGKSTMREAIVRLLLPGKKIDTTDGGFMALTAWGSDRRFALSCEFECDGSRFELLRDFDQRRVELRCAATDELLTSEPAVAERLWALLQVGTREVYETTACLAQQEFAGLQAGKEVAELDRTLDDGTGVLQRAQERRKVEEALDGLKREFGTLNARSREAQELAERIERAEGTLAQLPEVQPEQAEELTRLVDEARHAQERVPEAESEARSATEARDQALIRLREFEANVPDERLVEQARCAERDLTQLRLDAERAQAAVAEAERDAASSGAAARSRRTLLAVAAMLVLAGAGLAIGLDTPWLWAVSAA